MKARQREFVTYTCEMYKVSYVHDKMSAKKKDKGIYEVKNSV